MKTEKQITRALAYAGAKVILNGVRYANTSEMTDAIVRVAFLRLSVDRRLAQKLALTQVGVRNARARVQAGLLTLAAEVQS